MSISDKIDWTTLAESATEHIVGKDINGLNIYERTFTGTYNSVANARRQVILTNDSINRVLSTTGFVEVATDTAGTVNAVPANGSWISSTGSFIASAMVVKFGGVLSLLSYNVGALTNLSYSVTVRYTKWS